MPLTAFERRFALVTSAVILALGLALYGVLARFATELALQSAAADAQRESAVLARQAVNLDLSRPLSLQDVSALQALAATMPPDYLGISVWAPDGHIAFSTDPAFAGRRYPPSPRLSAALGGVTQAGFVDAREEDIAPRGTLAFRQLLEAYTPLQLPAGRIVGAFELYRSPVQLLDDLRRERSILALVLGLGLLVLWASLFTWVRQASTTLTRQNASLHALSAELRHSYNRLAETTRGALLALSEAVEAKDTYTAGHVRRVRDLALAIGERLGVDGEAVTRLEYAAVLHDIGKLAVDDAILRKPGPLSPRERAVVETHSATGAHVVLNVPGLAGAAASIRSHHERWDGGGYPDRLAGDEIPLEARVIAVADAFDAMTTDRPYRAAMDVGRAREELERQRGRQFDPHVVDAALEVIEERPGSGVA